VSARGGAPPEVALLPHSTSLAALSSRCRRAHLERGSPCRVERQAAHSRGRASGRRSSRRNVRERREREAEGLRGAEKHQFKMSTSSRHAQLSARRVVRAHAGPAPPAGGAQERHHDGRAAVGTRPGTVCSGMRTRNGREFLRVLGQTASWMHSEAERIQPAGWPESGKLAYSSIGIPCLSDLLTNSHTNSLNR
jgi:hypothetical protein